MNANEHNSNLHIIQWNAHSLNNCQFDLKIAIYTTKPHIVVIQETWLKTKNKTPSFESYDVLRLDRDIRRGRDREGYGGLMMLVRKDLNYSIKKFNPFNNGILEIQAITIKSKSQDRYC